MAYISTDMKYMPPDILLYNFLLVASCEDTHFIVAVHLINDGAILNAHYHGWLILKSKVFWGYALPLTAQQIALEYPKSMVFKKFTITLGTILHLRTWEHKNQLDLLDSHQWQR